MGANGVNAWQGSEYAAADTEAVIKRCSRNFLFWETSQNALENTLDGVLFSEVTGYRVKITFSSFAVENLGESLSKSRLNLKKTIYQ